jgi:hypothetical protein
MGLPTSKNIRLTVTVGASSLFLSVELVTSIYYEEQRQSHATITVVQTVIFPQTKTIKDLALYIHATTGVGASNLFLNVYQGTDNLTRLQLLCRLPFILETGAF